MNRNTTNARAKKIHSAHGRRHRLLDQTIRINHLYLKKFTKRFLQFMENELSRDELLSRCNGGFTQNSNESFNATVWSMAPKSTSSGKHILNTAVYISVGIYNDGLSTIMMLMQNLGMTIGPNCYNFCVETDERRIDFSERSLSDAAKKARISLKASRKEEEEANIDLDGQMYGAGIAD
ncbi:uncharacterized protein LOC105180772 [Harpegnathos saltator]|nr:uncharacterized protein LOC105180772 [Harpegnathos saltator]